MSTTTATYSIHLANTKSGEYDVRLPLLKPFHINKDGVVVRHEMEEGSRVVGFMDSPEPGPLTLHWAAFEADPSSAIGKYLVIAGIYGSLSSYQFPITRVTIG